MGKASKIPTDGLMVEDFGSTFRGTWTIDDLCCRPGNPKLFWSLLPEGSPMTHELVQKLRAIIEEKHRRAIDAPETIAELVQFVAIAHA
jgi:hypothetical protein